MAALQNAVALHSRTTPLSTSSSTRKPFALSFSSSSSFSTVRLPTLWTSSLSAKSRGGVLVVRMADTTASSYATALADVADSNGTLEATSADVEKIGRIFSDDEVREFFANPVIEIEKKRAVLDEIVQSSGLQPRTGNFINILIDMNRVELIKDIVEEFEVVYNKMTDTELAVVTSVVKLENEHLAQIARGVQRLTGAKNVRIKTVIDPSLVAGFTIRYGHSGSKLVDMSVRKQLEELATALDLDDVQLAA
uniref:Uncharacterized protein n=1 Tax=Opuntia streptacantha TaxID=393608 RepID=A0A7C8YFJ7_OPUST